MWEVRDGAKCDACRGVFRLVDWVSRDARPWLVYECDLCRLRREVAVCSYPQFPVEIGNRP